MRTNKFLPFLIALALHLAVFIPMLKKAPDESVIAATGAATAEQRTVDLSSFSLQKTGREKKASPAPLHSPENFSAATSVERPGSSVAEQGNETGTASTSSSADALEFNQNPEPVYPRMARVKGIEGTVRIRAYYENGKVIRAEVMQKSGNALLDEAAVAAILKWQLKGNSRGTFDKTFEFRLKN